MSKLNKEWAVKELNQFMHLIDWDSVTRQRNGSAAEILGQRHVVEQILDRVLSGWRSSEYSTNQMEMIHHGDWIRHMRCVPGAIALLERDKELSDNLGEFAPTISVTGLHPWVWSGAQSLWQSGHYRSAIEDALKKVNAETQNRVSRRDVSETKLFQESFSTDPPQMGKPRLRRMLNDGSETYRSLQAGAMKFAEGIYSGIRNPLTHETPQDMNEQVALEFLAALSVLARWVDDATLEEFA